MPWFENLAAAENNLNTRQTTLTNLEELYKPKHDTLIKHAKDYEAKAAKYTHLMGYKKNDAEFFDLAKNAQQAAVTQLSTMKTFLQKSNYVEIYKKYIQAKYDLVVAKYQLKQQAKCEKKLKGLSHDLHEVWINHYKGKVERFESEQKNQCEAELGRIEKKFEQYQPKAEKPPISPEKAFDLQGAPAPSPSTTTAPVISNEKPNILKNN
jgi:hypothetical protein